MLLTGTYSRVLDEKGRMPLPKPVREALSQDGHKVLFMAPGTDGSLSLFPENAFEQMARQLASHSPTEHDVRAFSRLFYAQAQRVELDGQGRVRIPPELVKLVAITKDIVLLGVRDHLEVWDRATWEHYFSDKQPHYDRLAEKAFGTVCEPSMKVEPEVAAARPTQPR